MPFFWDFVTIFVYKTKKEKRKIGDTELCFLNFWVRINYAVIVSNRQVASPRASTISLCGMNSLLFIFDRGIICSLF